MGTERTVTTRRDVWFWQRTISPHMAYLAIALAVRGHHVTYNVEEDLSESRRMQGWAVPDMPGVEIRFMETDEEATSLVHLAPVDSIHVCQGVRGNGRVGHVQEQLGMRGMRYWVTMEMVDDSGAKGVVRSALYRSVFARSLSRIDGVLAIGGRASSWIAGRGVPSSIVFPFAYFLPSSPASVALAPGPGHKFRFLFVGRLVPGKRVDLLIDAMGSMPDGVDLHIIGHGPQKGILERQAASLSRSGISVEFLGVQPSCEVRARMASADCVVLPSRYDGWGAVVSEALMSGTPAICSDSCGSAVVVPHSGHGGVFGSGDLGGLVRMMRSLVDRGPLSVAERRALQAWANRLSAEVGAAYLEQIVGHRLSGLPRPTPPWELEA